MNAMTKGPARTAFPQSSRKWPDLLSEMRERTDRDADPLAGQTAIFFFLADEEAYEVGKRAYMEFFSENALGAARAYPGIGQMEREICDYALGLMHAPETGRSIFTTGGTESIFVATRAAREAYRAARSPSPGTPLNIVMPVTGHPAFDKSALVMDLEVRRAPLRDDMRVDVNAMRSLIDERTMMLVGSAPCFPHGVIDPLQEISDVAVETGVWLHADACVGGWVAPFFERIGRGTPVFDFRLPGVRSISADLHKFGFTPKPASTLLFRDAEDIERATYRLGYWPSGVYTTATFSGTRPGAAVAAAWAVINHMGMEGYERAARAQSQMVDRYLEGLLSIEGIRLHAKPDVTILNFGSDQFDIYAVADGMKARGWVPGLTSQPRGMHTMLSMQHEPVRRPYLADLRKCVEDIRKTASTSSATATY
jgi:glutamate/tyrosine decarboxylase-like PLP-dependent enzyme